MNVQLREEVVTRLLRDFDFKTNNKENKWPLNNKSKAPSVVKIAQLRSGANQNNFNSCVTQSKDLESTKTLSIQDWVKEFG